MNGTTQRPVLHLVQSPGMELNKGGVAESWLAAWSALVECCAPPPRE